MPRTHSKTPTLARLDRSLSTGRGSARAEPILYALEAELRDERINRLATFLRHAADSARRSPTPSWHSRHVAWAINRLDALGYRFPETDEPDIIPSHPLAKVAA